MNEMFLKPFWSIAYAVVFICIVSLRTYCIEPLGPDEQKNLAQMVVPIDVQSQTLTDATSDVVSSLPTVISSGTIAPTYQLTPDHRYVLYGNLFGADGIFALIELPVKAETDPSWNDGRFAFAQYVKGKWVVRGLWNIGTTWRPKEWVKSDDDYLPAKPAEKPFELEDFNGDGVPEVLVAGEVEKYYQAWYLFQFDPKSESLHLLVSAMARPKVKGGYLLLDFNSGRRAIWGETDFLRWDKDGLCQVASWHNESPYNGTDPEFDEVGVYKRDGTQETFHIENSVDVSKNQDVYEITEGDQHFATVVFKPKTPVAPTSTSGSMEDAWLFEHLAKVPGKLLPVSNDEAPPDSFEKHGTVSVKDGSKEAIRRLKTP